MNSVYLPPYVPPDEEYWNSVLEEGPIVNTVCSDSWTWADPPEIPIAVWDEARHLQTNRHIMQLTIDSFNRGGLIAHWKGVECFIPASHILEYPFPADPEAREARFSTYLGRSLRLCIIEVEPLRNRILLSERQIETCEKFEPDWPDWLNAGNTCTGHVTSVRPFGAFVNIGPLEGMIHISEISWGRVRHPQDFLQQGQAVEVLILNVDTAQQRVGLSLKRLTPNPWDTVDRRLRPGDEIEGTIVSVERFGVFMELVTGIEGLLHISAICNGNDPEALNLTQCYSVGQSLRVRVVEIAPREHRIALSLPNEDAGYDFA